MVMSQARAHRNPHASRAEHMSESRPSRRLVTRLKVWERRKERGRGRG